MTFAGRPEIRKEIEKKPDELLERLKIVKVTSQGSTENPASKRPLPQDRQAVGVPTFGFEEPKHIPQGKCSLRQALDFITKHQDDPKTHSVKSIAEARSMKESDVDNIVKHFRVFELYVSRESKTNVAKSTLESLGVGKVVTPMFKPKFAHLEPTNVSNELPEKK
ncbi:Protein NDUFAF4 like protein [Argiope bruennichi]|uniref:Protein NDUFAF4 like protein n=1 Tax=Argiope bruennichi TaxID=94029 RepID=A0A8T0EVT3_ARGBR|nr:Protein NDUFAF4 like protein [Argiope bruennichi]